MGEKHSTQLRCADGTYTYDVDEFLESWQPYQDFLEKDLGVSIGAFDPGFVIYTKKGGRLGSVSQEFVEILMEKFNARS